MAAMTGALIAASIGAGAGIMGASARAGAARAGAQRQAESSKYGADIQSQIAQQRLSEQKRQFGITQPFQAEIQRGQLGVQRGQLGLQEKEAQRRAEAYSGLIGRGQELAGAGEKRFLAETAGPSPELQAVRQDVLRQSTPSQQRALSQTKLALREQGVRGPQAALAVAGQTRGLQQDLMSQLNRLALGEAQRRRESRAGFFREKAGRGQAGQLN